MAELRARVGRPQLSDFIAGRPKAALLFWFSGDFRFGVFYCYSCYIHKYRNR